MLMIGLPEVPEYPSSPQEMMVPGRWVIHDGGLRSSNGYNLNTLL